MLRISLIKMSRLSWPLSRYPNSSQHPSWLGNRTFHNELFVKEVKGAYTCFCQVVRIEFFLWVTLRNWWLNRIKMSWWINCCVTPWPNCLGLGSKPWKFESICLCLVNLFEEIINGHWAFPPNLYLSHLWYTTLEGIGQDDL